MALLRIKIPSVCVMNIAIQHVIHEYIAWLLDNKYFWAFLFPFSFICIFNKFLPLYFLDSQYFSAVTGIYLLKRIPGNRPWKKLYKLSIITILSETLSLLHIGIKYYLFTTGYIALLCTARTRDWTNCVIKT